MQSCSDSVVAHLVTLEGRTPIRARDFYVEPVVDLAEAIRSALYSVGNESYPRGAVGGVGKNHYPRIESRTYGDLGRGWAVFPWVTLPTHRINDLRAKKRG